MLESDGALNTWSLLKLPQCWGGAGTEPIMVTQLPDHRLAYLNYEGEVSGDRGSVYRVAQGRYESVSRAPNRLKIAAQSGSLEGTWELTRHQDSKWLLAASNPA